MTDVCFPHHRRWLLLLPTGAALLFLVPDVARAAQQNWCGCLAHQAPPCSCSVDFGISPWATHSYEVYCDINDDGKADPFEPTYGYEYSVIGSVNGRDANTTCTTGWSWLVGEWEYHKDTKLMGKAKQCTNWSFSKTDHVTLKVSCESK